MFVLALAVAFAITLAWSSHSCILEYTLAIVVSFVLAFHWALLNPAIALIYLSGCLRNTFAIALAVALALF